MFVNDLRLFTQDARKSGENVARTLRILAKVLLDWSLRYTDSQTKQNSLYDKPLFPLGAIEFDKMSILFWRLWNELHNQKKVRFRGAFFEKPGFHGPGNALKINRKQDEILGKDPDDTRHSEWAYTTEIIEKLKPPWSNARLLFHIKGKSCNPKKCKVYPGLDQSLWDLWLSSNIVKNPELQFLTPSEVAYVQIISSSISELTKEQIRALGTHYSAPGTFDAIDFNLSALRDRFDKVVSHLNQKANPDSDLNHIVYTMVTTAREILRKSDSNRKDYETAFNKCHDRLSQLGYQGRIVLNAFTSVQDPAHHIWKDGSISEIRKKAKLLVDFCVYCRRGLVSLKTIPNLHIREMKESEKAFARLREFTNVMNILLPNYKKIESLSGSEWAKVLSQVMARILDGLPSHNRRQRLGVP